MQEHYRIGSHQLKYPHGVICRNCFNQWGVFLAFLEPRKADYRASPLNPKDSPTNTKTTETQTLHVICRFCFENMLLAEEKDKH